MEEREVFARYAESGDRALRNAIAEKYLYLAEILAKKYAGRGVEYDDLYQVACMSVVKAVERFDPAMGLKFSSFAAPTVEGDLKHYFRDKSRAVRLPRRVALLASEIRAHMEERENAGLPPPSAAELAERLHVTEEDVVQAMEGVYHPVSLDTETPDGGRLYEVIADERDDYAAVDDADEMRAALSVLSDNERELVTLRFRAGKSQSEIAAKWGVSQMFVSRLERKVVQKLRAAFSRAD